MVAVSKANLGFSNASRLPYALPTRTRTGEDCRDQYSPASPRGRAGQRENRSERCTEVCMFKRVLLCHDGTEYGRRALRQGAELAISLGSEIHVLILLEDGEISPVV